MRFRPVLPLLLTVLISIPGLSFAEPPLSPQEQAMSEALDLWREGRFEQLFEQLSHRGRTSREQFVKKMGETSVRPACCFQKLENFKVLNEKRTEATVYAKVGLEGTPGTPESSTREFRMSHDGGAWRMQLGDISNLAGLGGKKAGHAARKTRKNSSPYHN